MLHDYVQQCHLPWPAPDKKMCRETLAAAGGSLTVLKPVLRTMLLDKRLSPSISYAWFPVTVASQWEERKTA
jgi:hypothetical protein